MDNKKDQILKILSDAQDGDLLDPIADKIIEIFECQDAKETKTNKITITPRQAAMKIWDDLDDRSGFELGSLQYDDPEIFEEIISKMSSIIKETI